MRKHLRQINRSQSTTSISPGLQDLSNQGSSGPYSLRTVNQPLPGTVGTQLDAFPGGGSGPNQTDTLPSSFACTSPLWLLTLGWALVGVCWLLWGEITR